jgi:hypothetical protein
VILGLAETFADADGAESEVDTEAARARFGREIALFGVVAYFGNELLELFLRGSFARCEVKLAGILEADFLEGVVAEFAHI